MARNRWHFRGPGRVPGSAPHISRDHVGFRRLLEVSSVIIPAFQMGKLRRGTSGAWPKAALVTGRWDTDPGRPVFGRQAATRSLGECMPSGTPAAWVSGDDSGISVSPEPAFPAAQTALGTGGRLPVQESGDSVVLQGKAWTGVPAALVSLGCPCKPSMSRRPPMAPTPPRAVLCHHHWLGPNTRQQGL